MDPGPLAARWTAVDQYLDQLCDEDDALREAQAAADAAGLPDIAVSTTQGRLLELLGRMTGARRALEVGTLAGVSTLWLARGLAGPERHVTTLELDPAHAAVARSNLERAGLGDLVDIRVGPAAESLASLAAEKVEPFDLVFIDADKPSNPVYLELALALSRAGTVLVVDNVVRQGAVADAASEDPRVQGSRAVIEAAARHPRLVATALQTVGRKGYDGMLIARVVS